MAAAGLIPQLIQSDASAYSNANVAGWAYKVSYSLPSELP